jgi:uncharacterized iron-regulated membrane protein
VGLCLRRPRFHLCGLTTFVDQSSPRPGYDELYLSKALTQNTVTPDPIIIVTVRKIFIPLDLNIPPLLLVSGMVFWWRRRKKQTLLERVQSSEQGV